jgi:hypothetical protein
VIEVLKQMTDTQIAALHRCAKTRARAFFKHPRCMMALRNELELRGLSKGLVE